LKKRRGKTLRGKRGKENHLKKRIERSHNSVERGSASSWKGEKGGKGKLRRGEAN